MQVEGYGEPAREAPRVWTRAAEVLARTGLRDNVYVRALAAGELSREAFRLGQEQFFYAVEHFSRPMAALVARIPDPRARLDILHNVVEEHGDFERARFHETTFRAFLRSLGSDAARLEQLPLWPEVRAFNAAITAACVLDEVWVGVTCMGIIEHAFAAISARIGQAVVGQGWVTAEELVHYKLHAEIDERHAEEFYRVVEPTWDDPTRRYQIEQGLELGAYVFGALYEGLYRRASQTT
ncbi:MAG: TenA family transcriptional regulator [Planctomycetota bacterium]